VPSYFHDLVIDAEQQEGRDPLPHEVRVQSFTAEKVKEFGANSPLGRPAQPAELAPAYVFLAADESRFVTGEILGVTGGPITA
jgi:NAD(P)-dependent dehydrogenase (short-subunit alcohol dehydrogenase family)